MPNSSKIIEIKDKITRSIINDENIFHAIDSPYVKNFCDADKLVGTHIFRFHQNPNTLDKAITFLTIQVHIKNGGFFTDVELEIWIISHQNHIIVDNIPKITADRNDYIAFLLDKKFNGCDRIGDSAFLSDGFTLIENSEGTLANDYLYRKLIFETRDINNSLCGGQQ